MFEDHFYEAPPDRVTAHLLETMDQGDYVPRKKRFLERLAQENVKYDGTHVTPTSSIPRVIPCSYRDLLKATTRAVAELLLGVIYSPQKRTLLSNSAVNRNLIEEFGVLDHLPQIQIGGARFDFAIAGPLTPDNPPRLLEVNMLDYGGSGWIPTTQEAWLDIMMPELKRRLYYPHPSLFLGRNLKYVNGHWNSSQVNRFRPTPGKGTRALLITSEAGDTDCALTRRNVRRTGVTLGEITENDFADEFRSGKVRLDEKGVETRGQWYDIVYLRGMSVRNQITEYADVIAALIRAKTPLYDGFATILVEDKGLVADLREILPELVPKKKRDLLEKVFLPTERVTPKRREAVLRDGNLAGIVLKEANTHMGEGVYFGEDIRKIMAAPDFDPTNWTVQEMVRMNIATAELVGEGVDRNTGEIKNFGHTSPAITGIVDLAVYITYVWDGARGQLLDHRMSGLMTRFNDGNFKVNISAGGAMIPTFIGRWM